MRSWPEECARGPRSAAHRLAPPEPATSRSRARQARAAGWRYGYSCSLDAMQQRMAYTKMVVLGTDVEAGFSDESQQIVGTVHSADAVGDTCEVERRRVDAVGGGFVLLPVPQKLEHEQRAMRRQRGTHARKDGGDICLGEAIEQLAHPERVGIVRQRGGAREQIDGVEIDPVAMRRRREL